MSRKRESENRKRNKWECNEVRRRKVVFTLQTQKTNKRIVDKERIHLEEEQRIGIYTRKWQRRINDRFNNQGLKIVLK